MFIAVLHLLAHGHREGLWRRAFYVLLDEAWHNHPWSRSGLKTLAYNSCLQLAPTLRLSKLSAAMRSRNPKPSPTPAPTFHFSESYSTRAATSRQGDTSKAPKPPSRTWRVAVKTRGA